VKFPCAPVGTGVVLVRVRDPDLAGIRADTGLAKLRASERAELVKVWSDVDALLKSWPERRLRRERSE
jgi:hypothetical protein